MFQFAKFEKSKECRLATKLGYDFPIGDPWITNGISLCIHPMHSFRSCTRYTEHKPNLNKKKKKRAQLHHSIPDGFVIRVL
ncbi:hypothetical protein Patl1_30190 [Pistacia atlantica]|uniref:Uncharacterized protein n=1 Tax=Pistacia atlantica TaxID=434234 RepID=A0ACC1ABQ5_9ROSI|nr:hypothetical protein Patl1_30190 [Pistacia atlantica]